MSVREYIGARYVPKFADPIAWDSTKQYEPLTIVTYQGNSFTSRQYVPEGIEITNSDYWVQTGNYNAQIEGYRNEVYQLQNTVEDVQDIIPDDAFTSSSTIKDAIDELDAKSTDIAALLPESAFSSSSTVADAISSIEADIDTIEAELPSSAFSSSSTVADAIDAINEVIQSDVIPLSKRNAHVILIGDSYVHDNNSATATIGNSIINLMDNWDVYNAADGGSAFTFGGENGRTYKAQFDFAKNNYANFNQTDAVIVIGSRNEAGGYYSPHYPTSNLGSTVDTFLDDVTSSLPNAKVYIFPSLWDWIMPNSNLKAVQTIIEQIATKYNVFCAKGCWSWGIGEEQTLYMGGTNIHPNQTGCDLFAKYIIDAIDENREYCWINHTAHIGSDGGNYHLNIYTQEDNICLQGAWVQNNASAAENRICHLSTLPLWLRWKDRSGSTRLFLIGYGWCSAFSSSTNGNNGLYGVFFGSDGLSVGMGVESRSDVVLPDGFTLSIQSCQSVFYTN